MLRLLVPLFLLPVLTAADDPWTKVRDLKSGSEVRIFKRGVKQPVEGKFDQVTEESVVLALKSEQAAIPKEEIDRVDYRPARSGGLLKKESTIKQETGRDGERAGPQPNPGPGPSTSTSTGLAINTRPGFETVYRRLPTPK